MIQTSVCVTGSLIAGFSNHCFLCCDGMYCKHVHHTFCVMTENFKDACADRIRKWLLNMGQNSSDKGCSEIPVWAASQDLDYYFVFNLWMRVLFCAHYRHMQVCFSRRVDTAPWLQAKLFQNCRYLYETSLAVVKVPLGSVADADFFVSLRVVSIVHLPVG